MSEILQMAEIHDAIKFLRSKGYVVRKLSEGQIEDAKECEKCGFEGDCLGCRCNVCIIQC